MRYEEMVPKGGRRRRPVLRLWEAAEKVCGSSHGDRECVTGSIFPDGFLIRLREAVVNCGDVFEVLAELDGDTTLLHHASYAVGVIRGWEDHKSRHPELRRRETA